MGHTVALCGLTARDARLLETVINRAGGGQHAFQAVAAETAQGPRIAIVDAGSPISLKQYQELRDRNPQLVSVTISDHGMAGDSRYRIERKSLFLQVVKTLQELAEYELGGSKVSAHPAANSALAQKQTLRSVKPAAPTQDESNPLIALVVDDSLTVREQLRQALARLGIASDQADSAEAAMELLSKRTYSLTFLDVVMPGTDGYELCRKIKQNPYTRAMPVLMLTSRSSPFDRARGALSGCDSYLTKPITWDIFSDAVDKTLLKLYRNDRAQMLARGYRA